MSSDLNPATFDWIKRHAIDAASLERVSVPADPSHIVRYHNRDSGMVLKIEAVPKPREYVAANLSALAGLVLRHYETRDLDAPMPRCTVFVGEDAVVAVFDETGERRERVTWKLTRSETFDNLKEADGTPMDQKEFLRFLRYTIRGHTKPTDLTSTIKQIRFENNSSGTSQIQTGKESLGKKVEMSIAGIDATALPEDVEVSVPVYDDLLDTDGNVMRFSVQTALETDIVSQKFTVRLLDGELRNTVLRARAVIATDLTEALQSLADAVHVCLGHPNAA